MLNQNKIEKSVKKILEVPFWTGAKPEDSAILILPGIQGYRIPDGSKIWPSKGKYLWVAGTRGDPSYSRPKILEMINKQTRKSYNPNIETQRFANNTVDQMMWATELLKEYENVNHVILTTALYHTSRCTLTLLKAIEKQSLEGVVISPVPIIHSSGPSFDSQEFQEELKRIPLYQEKGDVATFKDWNAYLKWRKNFT